MDPALPALPPHPFDLDTAERVGVIVLDCNGHLLVVEGAGRLSLPKGCRHLGETEWDGAMRECYEETGLDLEDPLLPVTLFRRNVKLRWGTYQEIHLGIRGNQLKTKPQAGETSRVFWINPKSAKMQRNPACNADLRDYLWRCGGSRRASSDWRYGGGASGRAATAAGVRRSWNG